MIVLLLMHCTDKQALCLVDMINQHVLPAARATLSACPSPASAGPSSPTASSAHNESGSASGSTSGIASVKCDRGAHARRVISTMSLLRQSIADLEHHLVTIERALQEIHRTADDRTAAQKSRVLRLETMLAVRDTVDGVEAVVPAHLWTLATYKELLFMDQHHEV